MTKRKLESKLAKIGIPATYCGITALVITLLASQIGVCDLWVHYSQLLK